MSPPGPGIPLSLANRINKIDVVALRSGCS